MFLKRYVSIFCTGEGRCRKQDSGELRLDQGYVDLASGNSARRYFVRDHLGSVRSVVNDSGTALKADDYYPLGGPLPTGTSTALQPEKYQGKEWNFTSGFNVYDFGARLYDPSIGRWLSQDPMAEKYYPHSPYLFCAGNPMKFVDPEGSSWYFNIENGVFVSHIDDKDDKIYMLTESQIEQFHEKSNILRKFRSDNNTFGQLMLEETLNIDPRDWMEDVLLRIPGNENNRDALRELLPDRWAKQTN